MVAEASPILLGLVNVASPTFSLYGPSPAPICGTVRGGGRRVAEKGAQNTYLTGDGERQLEGPRGGAEEEARHRGGAEAAARHRRTGCPQRSSRGRRGRSVPAGGPWARSLEAVPFGADSAAQPRKLGDEQMAWRPPRPWE